MTADKNLADVFGTPAVSSLAGRLAPVAAPPAQPVAPAQAVPVATPVAHPVAPTLARSEARPVADETTTKQITVYVLPHVPAAIRAAKDGRTNATVVYDAVEACHNRLPALLAARHAAAQSAGEGLFTPQPGTRTGEPQRVPWTFKATPANRATLDGLVITCGATSRSELVSAALETMYSGVAVT